MLLTRAMTAYSRQMDRLTANLLKELAAIWRGLRTSERDPYVASLAGRSIDVLEDALELSRRESEAFYDIVLGELDTPAPEAAREPTPYPRNVENPLDVWTRPAVEYRRQKALGMPEPQALEKAIDRATKLGSDDLAFGTRNGVGDLLKKSKIQYYRRVIRPELSKTGVCGLCVAASTRKYRVENLMPLHANCNCIVMPITDDQDPGKDFNQEDLNKLYKLAGSTYATDLTKVKYKIDEHGELGPYLVRKKKVKPEYVEQSTPKKLDEKDKLLAQLKTYEKTIPELEARLAAGEDVKAGLDWQKARVKKIKTRLGL